MDPVEQRIREFISKEFLEGAAADFDADDSLLETGLIDSIGLFRLVAFLEEAYRIRIPDQDLLAENFRSISHIARYLNARPAA